MRIPTLDASVLVLALSYAFGAPASDARLPDPDGKEQNRYDEIVNAFIAYDIGQLGGRQGAIAASQFAALRGDAAIPALVRGVNKAARMRQSCPIIVLAGRLEGMLSSTSSRAMLDYAINNLDSLGSGIVYADYVERLRRLAERKAYGDQRVERKLHGGTVSQVMRAQKPVAEWRFEDLQEAIHQEKGPQLVEVLEELAGKSRKGAQYTNTLAEAIGVVPEDTKEVARGLLAQRLVRMTDRTLIAKLEDPNVEVRAAAVRAIGYKRSPLYKELAAAMRDKPMVGEYARQVLVKLSGEDFGPHPEATVSEWYYASKRWEQWAEQQQASKDEAQDD